MSSVYCSHHLAAPSQDVLTLMQASEEERKSVNHLIAQHTFNIAPNGYTSSSKKNVEVQAMFCGSGTNDLCG